MSRLAITVLIAVALAAVALAAATASADSGDRLRGADVIRLAADIGRRLPLGVGLSHLGVDRHRGLRSVAEM